MKMYAELAGDSKKLRIKNHSDNKNVQEYGTRFQPGTPHMRPAFYDTTPQLERDIRDVAEGLFK